MTRTREPIRVKFALLVPGHSTERMVLTGVRDELRERGIVAVEGWQEADIVHLFQDFILTRDALRAGRFPSILRAAVAEIPLVVSTDDLYFIDRPDLTEHPSLYPLHHATNRWLLSKADALTPYSESVATAFARYFDPEKIHVAPLAVAERFRPAAAERRDTRRSAEPFVLHASLASKRKNPKAIVAMAEALETRFVVAGSGWDEIIPERLQDQHVDVLGYVSEERLLDLYRDAAVFYFPTRHEGFGFPVLEAMSCGTAVVTSDVYSVPEVAGDAAVLCPPNDVDTHLDHIERLLDDQDARTALEHAALRRAEAFSWSRTADVTERVYRDLLANSR